MIERVEMLKPGTPFETLQTRRTGVVLGRFHGQAGVRVELGASKNHEAQAGEKTICGEVLVAVLT